MPSDTLSEDLEPILRGANDFIGSNRPNEQHRLHHLRNLQTAEGRLVLDIAERHATYLADLTRDEEATINARWSEIAQNQAYVRATTTQRSQQQTFDGLRQANEGAFPKNISPVIYAIPLILVGVAEWYVNYSTFAAMFIPVFAIAATCIVAAVFAWASHMHGAYLKQISEIIHPSVEYRNVLGRKIALVIATILLIAAFSTVVWLRYIVIADQLGISSGSASGTFGTPSTTMVWSRVGPTIILNLLIWGLGTLYSWALHEKIPRLRESFRDLNRANKKVDAFLRPFYAEQKRIKAQFDRERDRNKVATKEYASLLDDVKSKIERLQQAEAPR